MGIGGWWMMDDGGEGRGEGEGEGVLLGMCIYMLL